MKVAERSADKSGPWSEEMTGGSTKQHNEEVQEVHDTLMYTEGETDWTGSMHGMDCKRTYHYSSQNMKGREHAQIKPWTK